MIGGLHGENGDLNNKYLKKKSKRVGRKYLEALRWISQAILQLRNGVVGLRNFTSWKSPFRKKRLISHEKVDFATCEIAFQLGAIVFQ